MSGHKKMTVAVSSAERTRLHEAEMKLRFYQQELPETVQSMIRESQSAFVQSIQALEQRQHAYDHLAESLPQQVNRFEQENNRRLTEICSTLEQQVMQHSGRLADHVDEFLDLQAVQFQQYLQDQWDSSLQMIAGLELQLAGQEDRIGALAGQIREAASQQTCQQNARIEAALDWLDTASTLYDFIQTHYPIEGRRLVEIQTISQQLSMAHGNLSAAMPEAALGLAQNAYVQLTRIRALLEEEEIQWTLLRQAAWENGTRLAGILESMRVVPAIDLDGNELEETIDVNYWSGDAFSQVESDLLQALARLEKNEPPLDADGLERLLKVDLPALDDRLTEAVSAARCEVLSSQLRINIADRIVQALQVQGFAIESGGYQGEDMRNSFTSSLRDLAGNAISVYVSPDPEAPVNNEVHILSYDTAVHTDYEIRQRSREIADTLASVGLQVSAPVAVGSDSTPTGAHPARYKRTLAQAESRYGD